MRISLILLLAASSTVLYASSPAPFTLDFSAFGGSTAVPGRTIAAELNFGFGMAVLPDGSILAGQSTPQTAGGIEGGPSIGAVLMIPRLPNGDFGAPRQVIGGLSGPVTNVRRMPDGTILVDAGAASGRTITFYDTGYTLLGTINFTYAPGLWWHSTGMSLAVPGAGGTHDTYFIVGSQSDNAAGPQIQTSGLVTASLNPASVYKMTVRPLPGSIQVVSQPVQIADGLRNPYALSLDSLGNLILADNGQDATASGTGADTLNRVPAASIGNSVTHFGFPDSYTDFATCNRIDGNPNAIRPLAAICLIPNDVSQGVAGMAFVSPGSGPFAGNQGGEFMGFHGVKNAAGPANNENALLYYDFQSNQYHPIVHAGTNGIGHPDTLLVSGTSLYILDMSSQGTVNGPAGNGTSQLYEFPLSAFSFSPSLAAPATAPAPRATPSAWHSRRRGSRCRSSPT